MNILVIFTGGTIGSRVTDGWISPDGSCPDLLLSRFLTSEYADGITLTALSPYTTLSENITAEHINTLLSLLREQAAKYDGIIVTHGTDTLQYTAAGAALSLGDTYPVVFCSAQYPVEDPRSNAQDNFNAAVALIRAGKRGVFVTYRNNDGVTYCHHPLYLTRHGESNDDVYSIHGQYAGTVQHGTFTENPAYVPPAYTPLGDLRFAPSADILNILVHPADGYRYDLTAVRAVLLQPYHSGTLNTENPAFIAFCDRAKQANVPVIAVNMPTGVTYASGKSLQALGIRTTPAAAIPTFMRVWAALSRGDAIDTL